MELHQSKYDRRQHGTMVDHFLVMFFKARHLPPPMDEADIIDANIGHSPREFRQAMRAGICETVPAALRLLQRMEDDEPMYRSPPNSQSSDVRVPDNFTKQENNNNRSRNNNNRSFRQRGEEQSLRVNLLRVKDDESGADSQQDSAAAKVAGLPPVKGSPLTTRAPETTRRLR
jgi:hypothetical protein